MNKTLIIAGVVLAIIAIGTGVFFYARDLSNGAELTIGDSLDDLLSSGKEMTCSASDNASGSEVDMKIYVAEGKIRQDQTVSSDGQTIDSHTLIRDGYSYSWEDGKNEGIKMYVGEMGEQSVNNPQSVNLNLPEGFKMNCRKSIDDYSVFETPSNVVFQTFMDESGGVYGTKEICAMCDIMESEALKQACRMDLNCQ
jgi:hypothetical protein